MTDFQKTPPWRRQLRLALIAGAAFMWALRSQQFDDPEMQAERILHDDDES